MHKSTLAEVAREAGVTHQTASRILGEKAHLHATDTVERVRKAAQRLGYRPHASAQALRSGKATTLAMLTDTDPRHGHPADDLLAGVLDGTTALGWHLSIDRQGDSNAPQLLRQVLVSGVLVDIQGRNLLPIAEALAADRIPALWLNQDMPRNAISFDGQGAVHGLVDALLERGCRRLLYAAESHHAASHPTTPATYLAGFEAACRPSGKAWKTWLERAGLPTRDLVTSLTETMRTVQPDGIVCASPQEVHLLTGHVLPALNLVPGRDCHLATVGSRTGVRRLPAMAMIQPWRELGRQAVEALAARIDSGQDLPSRTLACTFDPTPGDGPES